MPLDVALALPDSDALGWTVALGEIEGGTFDWQRLRWLKPSEGG